MKLLTAERRGNDLTIRIHADESAWVVDPAAPEIIAVQSDGVGSVRIVPDPAAVREFRFGLKVEEDAPSEDEQIQSALRESALLVKDELDRLAEPEDLTAKHQLPQL